MSLSTKNFEKKKLKSLDILLKSLIYIFLNDLRIVHSSMMAIIQEDENSRKSRRRVVKSSE
jgi:hypothetical protein